MKKVLFVCLLTLVVALTASAAPDRENKHVVKKGETLYSISRSYGIKFKDLVKANPGLTAKSHIKAGQKLFIPGASSIASTAHTDTSSLALVRKPKATVVVPSTPDTPYKEEDNKARTTIPVAPDNALATINNDQPVITATKPVVVLNTTPFSVRTNSSNTAEYAGLFNQYSAHGYKLYKARGAANFLEDNTAGNPYLALYSNAETGSVIKVTNLMNKKTVYVKVVGRVPATDVSKEVILKLSNKVAKELGALDDKFLVEVAGVQTN